MSIGIVEERLKQYVGNSGAPETQALREITQELILYALSTSDFFSYAAFQGGTCLRILYRLNRFSEDMDFILRQADPGFSWQPFLSLIGTTLEDYGYAVELIDRSSEDEAVRKAFIKDDSIGRILRLGYKSRQGKPRKIKIKLEIDTAPPGGGAYETKYLGFPSVSSVTAESLPTMLAGKSHALLCRKYEKGRDWYDFLWYMERRTPVDYGRLSAALDQSGPWAGKGAAVDRSWYLAEMRKRIGETDWARAIEDIAPFISGVERRSLDLWGGDLFLSALERLP